MVESLAPPPRRRLTEVRTSRHLLPFIRASAIEDASVYWLPVSEFSISFRQRLWILDFIERLNVELKQQKLTIEQFLQLKYTRTELNERFLNTMFDYRPITGVLLAPGQQLPAPPTSLEVKRLTESHGPDGTINLDHLAADYCAWFSGPGQQEQRQDFFGVGGMLMVWIEEDQEKPIPKIEIPRVIRTHPAMQSVDFDAQLRKGNRLQHPFLKRSREVFAAHLPDGPVKRHAVFVLPRLRSAHFVDATPDTRSTWFEIFSVYCIESEVDRGILFAFKDSDFDERIIAILGAMRKNDQEYPVS
jgi:hypothetical protein